jgi:Mrp family chromosome partitioning ATPase
MLKAQHAALFSSVALPRPRFATESTMRLEIFEACRAASVNVRGPQLKSLGVTSSIRGEGRTTVALAMALVQAEDYGRRALLVEMDGFGRPSLAHRTGAEPSPGLGELLMGRASLNEVIQPIREGLTLIPSGNGGLGIFRVLRDALAGGLMDEMGMECDVIVADLPPLLVGSFTKLAAREFEGLLVVVRAAITPVDQLREATAGLDQAALLLNGAHSKVPLWIRRMGGL